MGQKISTGTGTRLFSIYVHCDRIRKRSVFFPFFSFFPLPFLFFASSSLRLPLDSIKRNEISLNKRRVFRYVALVCLPPLPPRLVSCGRNVNATQDLGETIIMQRSPTLNIIPRVFKEKGRERRKIVCHANVLLRICTLLRIVFSLLIAVTLAPENAYKRRAHRYTH